MRANIVTEPGGHPERFVVSPAPDDAVRRKLLFEGRPVADVEGVDVVAHFRIAGLGWLILLDFDCPFEEAVSIYLLGQDFEILDVLKIDPKYVSGFVQHVEHPTPLLVTFTFPGPDVVHAVTIRQEVVGFLRKRTRWLHLETRRANSLDEQKGDPGLLAGRLPRGSAPDRSR